ncbi:hypothetical protein AXF42_Ash008108 [Apostasia shenzhenica]|uniref:Uncharacterized protein n=1 Tax=Apostasia shenzhenica TaxID=1088818 RepID=A0A2I0A8J9_9ASPA|nr:hypothetical protein AXF42_Ash008108 [Apostasia shenzhenica]
MPVIFYYYSLSLSLSLSLSPSLVLTSYAMVRCAEVEQEEAAASSTRRSWRLLEMAKKHHLLATSGCAWGLRSRFNSLMAVFMAAAVVFSVSFSVTTSRTTGGRRPEAVEVLPEMAENGVHSCDLFAGQWVFDNSTYPLYSERRCRFMSDQTACEKFGRKNVRYQSWRWQPRGCDLPRFNATRLLESLRGKRLAFVGDSLNRNQWISMLCLLDSVIPDHLKSMKANGSLTSFKIKEYNVSIQFYWAPLLVESNSDDPVHHRILDRVVRAQSIEKHARHWTGADILVFNSYLWWRRDKMKVLWGSFEDKEGIYKEIETVRSYEMAIRTWAEWLEFHVDSVTTKLFFMSMSPTHSRGDEWGIDSNQNCYNETEPITGEGYWGRGFDNRIIQIIESTIRDLRGRGVEVQMLNITQLSEYRKDGHPSIYRKQWEPLTDEQLADPSSYADCIHWCLPGVPDVWNELLYNFILFK